MSTNVPLPTFGDTGFTSPDELTVLAGVLADINAAFGGNLDLNLSTPQGQWATALAATIGAFNDLFVDYTNEVDPARNSGKMQDAIARIYFLTRKAATPTVVEATLTGATNTVIPVGSLAKATDGTIYNSLTTVTIPAGGSINAQFAALTTGPIACPTGSLNMIYRTAPGWDGITNASSGEPGQDEETPADLESRRELTVAQNAAGILPAIRGVLLGNDVNGNANVPGIVDAYVTENNTTSSATIGGVTVNANSLYVCVEGGADQAVANAIWTKKNPGCGYTGGTTVTVADTNSGYVTPPTYSVSFQRASSLAINVAVTLKNSTSVPSDVVTEVQAVVNAQIAALARIGQPIYALSLAGPIYALGSWVEITALTVNGGASVTVDIDQFPTVGTVTVTLA